MLERISKLNPWGLAILYTVGVHVVLILLSELINSSQFIQWYNKLGYIFAVPSFNIVANDVVAYIAEFRGDPVLKENFTETALISGLGVFVIYMLAPFLIVKGYEQADKSENKKKRSWIWYVGAILLITSIVTAFIASTIGTKVYMNTNESIADSRDEDHLRSALMNLALDASYKLFLPQELGGGEGSFTAFEEEARNIRLTDLDSYDSDSPYEFVIHENISDSVITIIGVSAFDGKEDSFENINDETGKRQLSVAVTPHEENIFKMRASPFDN